MIGGSKPGQTASTRKDRSHEEPYQKLTKPWKTKDKKGSIITQSKRRQAALKKMAVEWMTDYLKSNNQNFKTEG